MNSSRKEKIEAIGSKSFDQFANSIINLFEVKKSKPRISYDFINIMGGTVAWLEVLDRCMRSVIGEINPFHTWLKPQLTEFFESFFENFHTDDDRLDTRRFYPYENLILKNGYKHKSFKKKMVDELYLDICSMFVSKESEENRRIMFLNCIKNFTYRTFMINKYCTP